MGGEQGEQEAHAIPDLHTEDGRRGHQLPRRGVDVQEHQVHTVPWIVLRHVLKDVSDFVESSATKHRARVHRPALAYGIDHLDSHRHCQSEHLGWVIATPHQHDGAPANVVGTSGAEEHPARTGEHVGPRHDAGCRIGSTWFLVQVR